MRCFLALADELNFTRAAARCHVTQQALSRTIAVMERRVGTALIQRRPRGCALTPAGVALLEQARVIVSQVDDLVADVSARAVGAPAGAAARLRVGVLVGGAGPVTVLLVHAFRAAHPEVSLTVRRLDVVRGLGLLVDGRVDVALVYGPQRDDDRLRITRLYSQPRVAVVSSASELAAAETLGAADLVGHRVGAPSPAVAPQWEGFFTLVPERNGEQPYRVGEPSGSIDEVLWNISTNDLMLTAPAHLADAHPADSYGIRYVPAPQLAAVDVFVARRRSASPIEEAFVDLARRLSDGLVEPSSVLSS